MRLLPETIQNFLFNRIIELVGVSIIFLNCFIFLSILSFSPLDPSLSNSTIYEMSNFGGRIGANISDILIQLFGYSSFLLSLVLLSWSYKLIFQKSLPLFFLNLFLLPFLLITFSLFLEISNLITNTGFISQEIISVLFNISFLTSSIKMS